MSCLRKINRREFLALTSAAAGGFVLGMSLKGDQEDVVPEKIIKPNVFIEITNSGKVILWSTKTEIGQGITTLATMVVAEELDVPVENVVIKNPTPKGKFSNMTTGGSFSAYVIFYGLRKRIAVARQLMINTAAKQWGVSPESCIADNGSIISTVSGSKISYSELVDLAEGMDVPETAELKDPKDFKILGKSHKNLLNKDIIMGNLKYGIDTYVPNMVYASIIRVPVVEGKLINFNTTAAEAVPGYIDTIRIEGNKVTSFPEYIRDSLAVIADSSWAAMEAAKLVEVQWELGEYQSFSTTDYTQQLSEVAQRQSNKIEFRNEGSCNTALKEADYVIEALYEGPFLSHSPLEPMNTIAEVKNEKCTICTPCHDQARLMNGVKTLTGFSECDIIINTTAVGGSFGRRLQVDYAMEAVMIALKIRKAVKVVWSRVEDTKFGIFRSPYAQLMKAAVRNNRVTSFEQHIACSSVWGLREPDMLKDGLDYTVIMPAKAIPYEFSNILMTQNLYILPVPVCWWRASYPSIHHTVQECWIDELAHTVNTNPYDFRLKLLENDSEPLSFDWLEGWGADVIDRRRLKNVLNEVVKHADWNEPKEKNQGRGLACSVYSKGSTYVAQVVDLFVENGQVKLKKVTCVVDCGLVLNPDGVEAQIEGGIIFGLSAALYGEITFENGEVQQNNYADYPIMRINDTPEIDVIILHSDNEVGGVGEPGTHPIMAATCNAVFDATGKRIRSLPISKHF